MTDAAVVPDPRAIVAGFKPEFEQLLYFALMEASETSWEPAEQTEGAPNPARRTRRRTRAKAPSKRARAAR